jgi:hypothetical protein
LEREKDRERLTHTPKRTFASTLKNDFDAAMEVFAKGCAASCEHYFAGDRIVQTVTH